MECPAPASCTGTARCKWGLLIETVVRTSDDLRKTSEDAPNSNHPQH